MITLEELKLEIELKNRERGEMLFEMAKEISGNGVILELGTGLGESASFMALGSVKGNKGKVYTIDKKAPDDLFRNIERRGLKDWIFFIHGLTNDWDLSREDSQLQKIWETWDKPVKLLFIDGNHSYIAVKKDFINFEPWVIENGLIVFDDTNEGGPMKLVNENILGSDKYDEKTFITCGNITNRLFYTRKVKK